MTASSRTSPVVLVAVPLTLAFVAWTLLSDGDAEASAGPPQPPVLAFAGETCPVTGPAATFPAARDEAAGLAHLERYPFDATEGVRAVELLRSAASCHRMAGDDARALIATHHADRAELRLVRDYRMSWFRFERALAQGRTRAALRESRWLLAVAGDDGGEWSSWLRDTRRALEVRRSQKRSR